MCPWQRSSAAHYGRGSTFGRKVIEQ